MQIKINLALPARLKPLLWSIFTLRCLLIAYVLSHQNYTWDDSFQYLQIAHNLPAYYSQCISSPYVPDLQRLPLYPIFLYILRSNSQLVLVVQFVIQSFTAVLIYEISKKYVKNYAIYVGLAYWIMPTSVLFSSLILTECLFVFLMIAGIWLMHQQKWILANLFISASILTRPNSIFLLFFMLVMGIYSMWKQTHLTKIYFFVGLVLSLFCVSSWVYRNYTISKEWRLSTLADNTLIHGRLGGLLCYQKKLPYTDENLVTQAEAYLISEKVVPFKTYYSDVHVQETELYTSKARATAYRYIFSNAVDYLVFQLDCGLGLYKGMGYRSWNSLTNSKVIAIVLAILQAFFSLSCVFVLARACLYFNRLDRVQRAVFLSVLAMLLLSLLPYADTRYRFPLESLIFTLWVKK
ncbi:MAG: glycosyltransferase family 39 protein [Bacteroidia bacterium]|nr:glycosyltransferase family 39 protein [Bacteroidia bacterium]MDW8346231.1 hypothetical protein [Bacteroidia bacterium]